MLDEHGVPISHGSRTEDSQLYHTDDEMISLEVDDEENTERNGNSDINGGSTHDGAAKGPHKRMTLRAPSSTSIRGWWRWAWTTLRVPDSMVFRLYGIDVWSYLQFMKFCIAVFFVLSIGTLQTLDTTAGDSNYFFSSLQSHNSPSNMLTFQSHCIFTHNCFCNLLLGTSMNGVKRV